MSENETLRCPCKHWEGTRSLALFDSRTQTYHCPVCQRTLEIPREASGTAREAPSLGIQSAPHSSHSPDAARLADELEEIRDELADRLEGNIDVTVPVRHVVDALDGVLPAIVKALREVGK